MKKKQQSITYIYWKYKGICQYCGVKTVLLRSKKDRKLTDDIATRDHIKPECKGGTWDESNMTLACRKCNMQKSGF